MLVLRTDDGMGARTWLASEPARGPLAAGVRAAHVRGAARPTAMVRSVGCPATVDGQDGASEIAGLRVGEHERGAPASSPGAAGRPRGISAVQKRKYLIP